MSNVRHPPWPTQYLDSIGTIPDITGLRRSRIVHDDGTPYLDRYHLIDTQACSARIHHWRTGDDQRAPHDHPWSNLTVVLHGELLEWIDDSSHPIPLEPGSIRTRPPDQAHRVELVSDEAWTLFVTGPIVRRWGFHTAGGWVHWTDWPHAGRYEQ